VSALAGEAHYPALAEVGNVRAVHHATGSLCENGTAPLAAIRAAIGMKQVLELLRNVGHFPESPPARMEFDSQYHT
jgi:hypothetical protein